jgi:hypothetical protein
MGSRTLPSECSHGRIFDWGDFGSDPEDGTVGAEEWEECATGRKFVHGRTLGVSLCNALGLDPAQVRSLTLTTDAESVATVVVERFVTNDEAGEMAKVLTEYGLVARETNERP